MIWKMMHMFQDCQARMVCSASFYMTFPPGSSNVASSQRLGNCRKFDTKLCNADRFSIPRHTQKVMKHNLLASYPAHKPEQSFIDTWLPGPQCRTAPLKRESNDHGGLLRLTRLLKIALRATHSFLRKNTRTYTERYPLNFEACWPNTVE